MYILIKLCTLHTSDSQTGYCVFPVLIDILVDLDISISAHACMRIP